MTNIEMRDQLMSFMEERFKRVEEKIDKAILTHQVNCPLNKDVKEIKEEQQKYWLIKKYPATIVTIGVVYGLSIILLFLAKLGII